MCTPNGPAPSSYTPPMRTRAPHPRVVTCNAFLMLCPMQTALRTAEMQWVRALSVRFVSHTHLHRPSFALPFEEM